MRHARDQTQSWVCKVKSIGACMVVCVYVSLCFRNIWTSFKVTKKVLNSHWDSWQNWVSLVSVKLMLSTDEIQSTWIYLCSTKPSWELGRGWPSWLPLILVINPLHLFEIRCSQDLVEPLKFLNRNLELSLGAFSLKTSVSWNKNKIPKMHQILCMDFWFNESKIHTHTLEYLVDSWFRGCSQNICEPGLGPSCNVGSLFLICHIWIFLPIYSSEKQLAILRKYPWQDAIR